MNRPRLAAALVVFLVAISIGVPVAYQAGFSSATVVAKGPAPKLLMGPEAAVGRPDFYDCYRSVRLPALRQFDRVQDCRPPGEGSIIVQRYAGAEPEARPASFPKRNRPLGRAFAASVAGGPAHPTKIAGAEPIGVGEPFQLAMAPQDNPAAAPGDDSPPIPGGPSSGNLIPPGFVGSFAPPVTLDAPTTPVVETPLPAGLPLLITGLIGLGAAVRRKRVG